MRMINRQPKLRRFLAPRRLFLYHAHTFHIRSVRVADEPARFLYFAFLDYVSGQPEHLFIQVGRT
jgi:hypothetical protein